MSDDNENGVPSKEFNQGKDVYIIYSFEDVAFCWEHATEKVRRHFKGKGRESTTDHTNRLFTHAYMYGRLATKQEYDAY